MTLFATQKEKNLVARHFQNPKIFSSANFLLRNNIVIMKGRRVLDLYNRLSVLFVAREAGGVNTNFWSLHESLGEIQCRLFPRRARFAMHSVSAHAFFYITLLVMAQLVTDI